MFECFALHLGKRSVIGASIRVEGSLNVCVYRRSEKMREKRKEEKVRVYLFRSSVVYCFLRALLIYNSLDFLFARSQQE